MTTPEIYFLGQILLGYIMQWTRGFRGIPNWISWAVFGLLSVGVFIWVTPDVSSAFHENWRSTTALLASFVMAATRGAAGTSSEAGIAPKTNTLI